VEYSTDEFAGTFGAQETRDHIAHHYRQITALAAAYESWNAGDLDGYLCLYDEGIALHGYSPEPMNKDQVRGFYQGSSVHSARRSSTSTRSCGTATWPPSGSP
jgi:hypothetical protein